VWISAGLGIAAGDGQWRLLLVGAALTLAVLVGGRALERRLLGEIRPARRRASRSRSSARRRSLSAFISSERRRRACTRPQSAGSCGAVIGHSAVGLCSTVPGMRQLYCAPATEYRSTPRGAMLPESADRLAPVAQLDRATAF